METKLKNFAQSLKPSEAEEERARRTLDKVAGFLKNESKFGIDRVIVSGSYGKSVSLEGFDVDVVVFVNQKNPPFKDVIQEWATILGKRVGVTTTSNSLQFCLDGIEFDLLPATNHTFGLPFTGGDRIVHQKYIVEQRIGEDLRRKGKYSSKFSSGLAESQLQFMKKQSALAHELVRLAKYWFKTIPVQKFPGSSMILELIAAYCASPNVAQNSILTGFSMFLKIMTNLSVANLTFGNSCDWLIQNERPMILDPSNRYNNLGRKLMGMKNRERRERLEKFASVTHGLLLNVVSIEVLFKKQSL